MTLSSDRRSNLGANSSPLSSMTSPKTKGSSASEFREPRHTRKGDRLSSSSLGSMVEWDLSAEAPSPAGLSTPNADGDVSPSQLTRRAVLSEGNRAEQRRAEARLAGTHGSKHPKTVKSTKPEKAASAKERSLSSSSAFPLGSGPMEAAAAGMAAEMEDLRCQLAEERERVGELVESKELFMGEADRAWAERDELVRMQGRLTKKMAEMEGEMVELKEAYEQELVAVAKKSAAKPQTGLAANEHAALLEQVDLLTQENEGLRCQVLESSRTHRSCNADKEAVEAKAAALERQVRELRLGMERERRQWEEEQHKLEFMLNDADIQAEKRAREVDAARRDAREQRQLLQELRQEMAGKLAAAEAQIARQEFEVAAAQERADAAESSRESLNRAPASQGKLWTDEKVKELESEVARLISVLAEKEMEVRRERSARESAETEQREHLEAMEMQANLMRDKIKALKKEKDMAVAAYAKRMATMQIEISNLIDQKDAHQDAAKRARASAEKAEHYLKALDVARVEVKRLRLERDLLTEKIRTLERDTAAGAGGSLGWLMPECLLKRAQDCGQVTPVSAVSDRD